MNWKILTFFLLALTLLFFSCGRTNEKFPQANVSNLPDIDVEIHRYGKTLFELDTNNFKDELKKVKDEFFIFLDADLDDTSNIHQLYDFVTDTQLMHLYTKSIEVYPDTKQLETELSDAFARYQYHFPGKSVPNIYTYISDLYYEMPIWIQNGNMIVALDLYLGVDFPIYSKLGLPLYKVRCMRPENLSVDIMKALYFKELVQENKPKTLLDRMVESGKLLVYLDAVLPDVADEIKICYTESQMKWANENEDNVWAFLVSNDLLYSTDYQTQTKLIQDGPFTTGFGNKSPSRLGVFMGWNIMRDFMSNNPDVSVHEMIDMEDSQLLLQKSGYKP